MTTRRSHDHGYAAESNGADGLVLNPLGLYIPLVSQEIADQVETVASSLSLPLCLYSNPETTGFNYPVELAVVLAGQRGGLQRHGAPRAGCSTPPAAVCTARGPDHSARRERRSGHRGRLSDGPVAHRYSCLVGSEFVAFHRSVIPCRSGEAALWSTTLAPSWNSWGTSGLCPRSTPWPRVCGADRCTTRRPLLPIPTRSSASPTVLVARGDAPHHGLMPGRPTPAPAGLRCCPVDHLDGGSGPMYAWGR